MKEKKKPSSPCEVGIEAHAAVDSREQAVWFPD